jgi:hypothetical protein
MDCVFFGWPFLPLILIEQISSSSSSSQEKELELKS